MPNSFLYGTVGRADQLTNIFNISFWQKAQSIWFLCWIMIHIKYNYQMFKSLCLCITEKIKNKKKEYDRNMKNFGKCLISACQYIGLALDIFHISKYHIHLNWILNSLTSRRVSRNISALSWSALMPYPK